MPSACSAWSTASRGAPNAARVDPEQEQVIAVPRAVGGALLRVDARECG